jgi:hypothetical protein
MKNDDIEKIESRIRKLKAEIKVLRAKKRLLLLQDQAKGQQ